MIRKINMWVIFAIFGCLKYSHAMAGIIHDNYTLDVYKSKYVTAEEIDKKYSGDLKRMANILLNTKSIMSPEATGLKKLGGILKEINQPGKFSYLSISPVLYPGGSRIGYSIDIVDKDEEKRLQGFLPKPVATLPDPNNLIKGWQRYEKFAFDYVVRNKIMVPFKHCPAHHCIFGFEIPVLRPYGKQFNLNVPKYKNQLVNILRNDKDELKRSAAGYLLGHLKSADEVVSALSPSMRDSSSAVRNSVMRVLAATAEKSRLKSFPIDDAIRALSYPAETDRNKALYMLQSITRIPTYATYVRKYGCFDVLEQYHMAQPNLHDVAYNVLINISGKHYANTDQSEWNNWASQHCSLGRHFQGFAR